MVPSKYITSLAAAADTEIDHVLVHGAPNFIAPPSTEVGYVNAVVTGAVQPIATKWRAILNPIGIKLKIWGVFCHSSPMVEFIGASGNPEKCELADLLVVHDDLNASGTIASRKAVLVQAKTTSSGNVNSPQADQFELYTTWPPIDVKVFTAIGRDLKGPTTPGTWADSGQYGIIDTSGASPVWTVVPPAKKMQASGGPKLGTFMAEMLDAAAPARGRDTSAGGSDDWSMTIDDLLAVTGARQFTHQATLGPGVTAPAGVSAIALATGGGGRGDGGGEAILGDGVGRVILIQTQSSG